ncbi:MAG: tripartite tricarboxylate transporter substrate binding protein [Burkholderiales bacterium]|nr:tripartite tricarboxylate transporter substrate binding protein [Burkholderiales bacterium]
MKRRHALLAAPALAAAFLLPGAATAQDYPAKTVKIVAPVQPGGGVDLVARTVAEQLTRSLGQTFIVENLSGGGGVIAAQAVAKAAPDGYTLMLGYVATHGTVPAVRKVAYDAVKDFTPIAMVAGTPNVLVIANSVPATDAKSLIEYAKANKVSYGSAGQGSLTHLAMEQFRTAAGFEAVHAAYRGMGPAITDILGGQTHMMMPGLAAAVPHIRAGKMKPIAVTGLKRHPLLPEVPTFEELGYKGFDGVQWYGIVGPAGMPAAVTKKLNDEINKAIGTPELQKRLSGEALDVMPMSPEQFGRFMQADIAKWAKLAKDRNITLDN